VQEIEFRGELHAIHTGVQPIKAAGRTERIGSLQSTTRPARRRAFKTKKFGVSTNNSIMCFIAMQTYKELTKKFVMQDKNSQ
jgi:hypothetical protein